MPGTDAEMDAQFFVYILTSKRNGTLYVGVTNNLARRLSEHKAKLVPGFTRKYAVDRLVYFEAFDSILEALAPRLEDCSDRETQPGLARFEQRIEFLRPLWMDRIPGCCAARSDALLIRGPCYSAQCRSRLCGAP